MRRIASVESLAAVRAGWIGCLLFAGISCTVFYVFAFRAQEWVPSLIAGLFIVFSVACLWHSVQKTLEYRRFGALVLELADGELEQGGELRASLDLHARDVPRVRASLVAYEWVITAGGKAAQRRQVERARSALHFPVRGGVAEIRMQVPRVQAAGELDWRLEAHAELPGVDLNRSFRLQVSGAAAPAPALEPPPAPQPAMPVEPEASPVAAPLLVAANLVPLAGVLLWDWRVGDVVILYWMENLVIGAFNVLRILLARPRGSRLAGVAGKVFLAGFFTVHYGMFCYGHGVFLAFMFPLPGADGRPLGIDAVVLDMLREPGLLAAVAALIASHGYSFVRNYLGRGEYRNVDPGKLMSRPYGRIVLVHLYVIAGGILVHALQSPVAPLVLFVALKTGIDYFMHRRERSVLARPPAAR
jgi:hypothetical protein